MRYFLQIAYCGTNYHGWQIQPNGISVQAVVNKMLSRLANEDIHCMGCGRTDAGVHASLFYLHFDTNKTLPDNFVFRLNRMFPSDIVAYQLLSVRPDAHARFDATYRAYDYLIHLQKNPFLQQTSTYINWPSVDISLMQTAAKVLLDYKDFFSFCKTGGSQKTTLCDLYESELFYNEQTKKIRYHVAANRFLRGMVRRIVGTLLAIGAHRLSIEELRDGLTQKKLFRINPSAPADGLYLMDVRYDYVEVADEIVGF